MAAETVRLSADHADFVDHLIAKGDFPNAEAVVALAIGILLEDEYEWQVFIDRINKTYERAVVAEDAPGPDVALLAVRRDFRKARESYASRHVRAADEDAD